MLEIVVQMPVVVSQQTRGSGHGFGLHVPGPLKIQPVGHWPAALPNWHAPVAGSQQTGPVTGPHGFGEQVEPMGPAMPPMRPQKKTSIR